LLLLFASHILLPSLYYASASGMPLLSMAWFLVILVIISVNYSSLLLRWVPLSGPSVLPMMDYSRGIPESNQTIVVVPAILTSNAVINELLESLESHYLANQDRHVYFALLTDWSDAPKRSMPEDNSLYEEALYGVEKLNLRYHCDDRKPFYIFH